MRSFFVVLFLLVNLGLFAQTAAPTSSPFGYELGLWTIQPEITGRNTEAEAAFSWGLSLAGTAQLFRNKTFTIETGLQIGFSELTQTVTERDPFTQPQNTVIREVEADAGIFHAGIPLFVKITPGDFGGYLKLGARGLLNFSASTNGRLVGPEDYPEGEEPPFPAGDVDVPAYLTVLETGIGYRFFGRSGRETYFEVNLARPLGNVLENAGPRDAANRVNYFDTTKAINLGVAFGFRFGR